MIFRRSLVREMTATAIGLFLVLMAILFTNLVLRLLARAAGGTVAPEGILALLGFNALFYFNILLSVTVFVTVLLTLTRWYRDSEMIVWFSSGQGLTAWLRPIMWFALPFFAAILVLSLYLSPWAEQRRLEYERQLESRDEITLLTPGLFREFGRAKLVVFVESINTFDGTIRNVFLHSVDEGKDSTTVARSGIASGEPERRPLHRAHRRAPLRGQARHRRLPGRGIRFARTPDRARGTARAARVDESDPDRDADRVSTDPVERAELFWRLSVPISALVLTLLAVPLAYVNPRIGRSFNLMAAGVRVHALQQLPQHRAELHRAGQARVRCRASCCRTRSRSASCCCSSDTSSALFGVLRRGRAPKAAPA